MAFVIPIAIAIAQGAGTAIAAAASAIGSALSFAGSMITAGVATALEGAGITMGVALEGALDTLITSTLVGTAVGKGVQAATGQDLKKTTVPVGPFSVTVGGGKPQFGLGLNVPLTKNGAVGINFGVVAGSGRKPSWNIGATLGGKLGKDTGVSFAVKPEYSWSGGDFEKGMPEVGVQVKKFKTKDDALKDLPAWKTEAQWSTEKFSFSAGSKDGSITLTKPKAGGLTVDLDILYRKVIDERTGKEMKLAAGVRFGKNKPVFRLGGAVDLNKDFRIQLDKTLGGEVNNIAVALERYRVERGERTKIAQKGIFKYNEETKIPTIELQGKEMIPLTFNIENKKLKNVIIDTQTITDYISNKLFPYPEDIHWQKKLGQIIEEPILKGIKLASGEKIPDKLMQFLLANFGGKEKTPFKRAIPEDLDRFVEQYAFPKDKEPEKLKNWQVDFLKQYSELSGIPEKYKTLEPLIEKIKNPSESSLLSSFLKGQISMPDYLNKTTYSVKDIEEKYYEAMKENNQLSSMEHISNFLKGDPIDVGNAIKELLKKQPEGKAAVLEKYGQMPEKIKYDIFSTWKRTVEGIKNIAQGLPTLISMPVNMLGAAPDTEWETVKVGTQEIKVPITRNWQTPEGKKFMIQAAKDLGYGLVLDPLKQVGVDLPKKIEEVINENPALAALTGPIVTSGRALWRTFSDDPIRTLANTSIIASNLRFFSQQARFAGAITRTEAARLAGAGLAYEPGAFASRTLDIAQGLEKASELIDPMNLLFSTAQKGINSFIDYKFPGLAKSLERRTYLTDLLAQENHAKIMRSVLAERDATNSLITSLEGFTNIEKAAIRKAMVTGDITQLPAAWAQEGLALKGKPTISKLQAAYDAISQNKYLENVRKRLNAEAGILNADQMMDRIWADAELTYGMSRKELQAKGLDPSYAPLLAKPTVTGPLKDALDTLKPRFEKEFVGDISTVEKLPLEQAIAKHHIDFVNAASDKITLDKILDYAKQQGFAQPWSIGKPLEKGNVIWDPYNYLKKNELAANFNETFFARLEQLGGNAEEALKASMADYGNLDNAAEKLGSLLKPGTTPVFQVPKWMAYEIESNLKNVFNTPAIFERPTAWAKTAYLGGRLGWIVNDFKDNAIRVLMQGGFDAARGNALAERWRTIIPDELNFHGIGYDLMSQAIIPAAKESEQLLLFPNSRMGEKLANIESKAWNALYANEKINKFMGKIDAGVDKLMRKGEYATETLKEVKRALLKDYAANFAWRWNELDKIAMSTIDDWTKNPAAHGTEIAATQKKVMKVIQDTLYDSSKVLPFLTKSERGLVKNVFLFPEFMIDTMKKAATLGIRYPYQATALSNLADMYNQYLTEEGDRPPWLKDAQEIGKNIWLQPLAGTMFDPDWGLMNPNATMNPLLQTGIEYITGRDLRTASLDSPLGEPFTDPSQLYYFNPLTQKMEIVSKAKTMEEIDNTIAGYQKGIETLLNEISSLKLSGPEIQTRLNRIDQAQRMLNQVWKPQKEMYEAGVPTEVQAPSFIELYLRKLPQWKILEDALQPYTKYDTSTLLEPKVILQKTGADKGQPKHDINVWLQVLRLLGASVIEYDVDKWRERQGTLKKAQQSVTFGQLINRIAQDDPELLAKIREDIIQGNIPLSWKELPWHEEIESRYGKAATLPPFELPAEFDLESTIRAIEYTKQSDKQTIDDQAREAIENLKFFQPELLAGLTDSIRAKAEEKKNQIDQYYDTMKQSNQMMNFLDEIKSASELKSKLEQMQTPVTASEIIKEMVSDLKSAGTKVKLNTAALTRALSEFLTASLQQKKDINFKDVVKNMAEVLGKNTSLTSQALLNALNKFVKIPAATTLAKQQADWATNRLNELAFIELKKQLTGAYPDTKFLAPDLTQLLADDIFKYYLGPVPEPDFFKGVTDLLNDNDLYSAISIINADAEEAIRKIQEANLPMGDLVIKAVEKKRKETVARTKKTYATKKRMQALFSADRVANARGALEKAISARKDFLEAMSFAHWKDIYDPNSVKTSSGNVPISAMLLALGAARLEINEMFGKSALDEFLASTEGKQYADFEGAVLSDYAAMADISAKAFSDNYQNFMNSPSKANFNYIKGLHSKLMSDKAKVPVFYRDSKDNTLYATSAVSTWKEEPLFSTKLQELDKYARVYSSPEYQTIEKATLRSYKTLDDRLRQGEKQSSWFVGVLLQK